MNRFIFTTSVTTAFAVLAGASGCNDEPQPAPNPPVAKSEKKEEHDHDHDHAGHDHEENHANPVDLGTKTAGGLTLQTTQEEPIKAGGEGAFRMTITGGKAKAVRFWVGVESGEDSVKAKADEESEGKWHTHLEVPDPLPTRGKFYAEIEPATGETFTVSFDLK